MLNDIEHIKGQNKTTIVLDPTENAFTFFKYKGEIIDLSEHELNENMGK